MSKKLKVSAILKVKNEEGVIGDALESVSWADEIIVVDSGSTDGTSKIAKKHGAKVFDYTKGSFADWCNKGLKEASGDWVIYIDADERVTPLLRKEIKDEIEKEKQEFSAFAIPRKNIILGKEMKHGGWWPDYVKRLFKRKDLKRWEGDLHEEPVFEGKLGHLKQPFTHLKDTRISKMVAKTNKWSEIEARLMFEAKHPKMSWWRFFRVMFTELWNRLIKLQGILDGPEGIIYGLYQSWSKFLSYAKLWEMQRDSQDPEVKSQKR